MIAVAIIARCAPRRAGSAIVTATLPCTVDGHILHETGLKTATEVNFLRIFRFFRDFAQGNAKNVLQINKLYCIIYLR